MSSCHNTTGNRRIDGASRIALADFQTALDTSDQTATVIGRTAIAHYLYVCIYISDFQVCFLCHHSCHYAHSTLGLNLACEITVLHLAGNNVALGILIRTVAGISCQDCRCGSGRAHHCVHEAYVAAVSAHSAKETGIALIGHGEVADEMTLTVKVDSETVFGIGCVQRLPFKTGHVDILVQAEIHHGVLLQHIAHVIQLGGTHYAVRIVFCAITGRIAVSLVMNRLFQTSEQVLNLLVVIVLCGIDLCRLFADNLRCLHIQSKAARRSDFLIHSSNLFSQGCIE